MLLEEDAAQRNKVPSANPDLLQMSSTPEGNEYSDSTQYQLLSQCEMRIYSLDLTSFHIYLLVSYCEGALVLGLVLDFLQTHHLEFSKSVFEPECSPVRIQTFS